MHRRLKIEIIAGSAEDCKAIEQGGADRIELCSAIELGGLTPSVGLVERSLAATSLPIMAMIRPRSGGFHYTPDEFQSMLGDLKRFRKLGVQGVVFGIVNGSRSLDLPRMRELAEAAAGLETVCHRAFDVVTDPFRALEDLIESGITRVLTSGQKPTAFEGGELIRTLVARAEGRLQILAGGGLRPSNLADFVDFTGVDQVHLSAFSKIPDASMEGVEVRFNGTEAWESSFRAVEARGVVASTGLFHSGSHDSGHDVFLGDQK